MAEWSEVQSLQLLVLGQLRKFHGPHLMEMKIHEQVTRNSLSSPKESRTCESQP